MNKKVELTLFLFGVIFICFGFVLADLLSSDSTNLNEWRMFGRNNNHTGWDGVIFEKIIGLNYANCTLDNSVSTPSVANGYVYVGTSGNILYQLNASNISQQIATYTLAGYVESPMSIANGYVYAGGYDGIVYQLNASDISQEIATYDAGSPIDNAPAVANGYVYIGDTGGTFYQLNASNVSKLFASYDVGVMWMDSAPAVAGGYVYIGNSNAKVYQFNSSDVSQLIATYTTGGAIYSAPAVANGYVYIGSNDKIVYQLNASDISQQIASYDLKLDYTNSAIAFANGYIYFARYDGIVYQLNASDISQQIANYTTGDDIVNSFTISDGYVYTGGVDKTVYQFNSSDVSQLIATYTTGGAIYSAPAVANGYVYIGSNDLNIYQLNANNISLTTNDFIAPDVSFVSPTNKTYTTSTIIVNISNSSDTASVWWNNGTENFIYTSLITLTLSNGDYTFIAYANDSYGNLNSTSVYFNVNVAATSIVDNQPSWGDSQRTYIINESSLKEGSFYSIHRSNKIKFGINSINHTLTLNRFNSTLAKITINFNPIIAYLEKNKLYKFDVDNNSIDDLNIRYDGMNQSKAIIFIQIIPEDITLGNLSSSTDIPGNKKSSFFGNLEKIKEYALIFVFVLITILILITLFLRIKNKKYPLSKLFHRKD